MTINNTHYVNRAKETRGKSLNIIRVKTHKNGQKLK